jgi:hypothetical protein
MLTLQPTAILLNVVLTDVVSLGSLRPPCSANELNLACFASRNPKSLLDVAQNYFLFSTVDFSQSVLCCKL